MSTTLTEIISNKLIFNVLSPTKFMSLTDYGDIGATVDSDTAPSDDSSRLEQSNFRGFNHLSIKALDTRDSVLSLGQVVVTRGAREVLTDHDIEKALSSHKAGNWGIVSKDDWRENDYAIKRNERVLSSYLSSDEDKFWIITEWDRSVTTILLPDEY